MLSLCLRRRGAHTRMGPFEILLPQGLLLFPCQGLADRPLFDLLTGERELWVPSHTPSSHSCYHFRHSLSSLATVWGFRALKRTEAKMKRGLQTWAKCLLLLNAMTIVASAMQTGRTSLVPPWAAGESIAKSLKTP